MATNLRVIIGKVRLFIFTHRLTFRNGLPYRHSDF